MALTRSFSVHVYCYGSAGWGVNIIRREYVNGQAQGVELERQGWFTEEGVVAAAAAAASEVIALELAERHRSAQR